MSAFGNGPPVLERPRGAFPAAAEFSDTWKGLRGLWEDWRTLDCGDYLRRWSGAAPDGAADRVCGVNHIAVYIGDYQSEDEVLAWHAYLRGLRDDGDIASVDIGPSYISPRQYGTQGWWLSVALPEGGTIETFACKDFGPWRERTVGERRALMSHAALEVRTEGDVRSVLEGFAAHAADLEIIAYTEADEVGHTYGHLRNNSTGTVVEIVYQASNADSGSGHAHD